MPNFKISIYGLDPDRTAVATGRNLPIHFKHAREIAKELVGMKLEDAQSYIEDVIAMKRAVPYTRHNKKVPHRHGMVGWCSGRFPVKAAKEYQNVLENLSNNATFKGFDLPRMKLIHVCAQRGRKLPGMFPRAQGRSSPKIRQLTHLEMVAEQV